MHKYHISRRTGKPALCNAQTNCPFGDLETEHYSTYAEAQEAFEKQMRSKLIPSFSEGGIQVSPLSKSIKISNNSVKIPRGLYIVGDPSHIAGKDKQAWRQWENITAGVDKDPSTFIKGANYNNIPIIAVKAPEKSAILYDNTGSSYGIDSGMVGLIPLSLAKKMKISKEEIEDESKIINFPDDVILTYDKKTGLVKVGENFSIRTEPDLSRDFDEHLNEDFEEEFSENNSYPAEINDAEGKELMDQLFEQLAVEDERERRKKISQEQKDEEEYQEFLKFLEKMDFSDIDNK